MVTAQRYTPVDRDASARDIFGAGQVRKNGTGWYVHSQSQPHIEYWTDGRTRCTCPDFQRRQPVEGCKHMRAVQLHIVATTPRHSCPGNCCPVDTMQIGSCCHGCPRESTCSHACRSNCYR